MLGALEGAVGLEVLPAAARPETPRRELELAVRATEPCEHLVAKCHPVGGVERVTYIPAGEIPRS